MSVAEQDKSVYCSSCGAPGARRILWAIPPGPLCPHCAQEQVPESNFGALVYERALYRPIQERFGELFEAAGDLLIAGVDDEDVIYPTLAYADRRGWSSETKEEAQKIISAGEDQASEWSWRGYVCEYIADGVITWRRLPVTGEVHLYPLLDQKIPEEVVLRILPHYKPINPKHIGSFYKDLLSAYNVDFSRPDSCRLDFVVSDDALLIHTYAAAGAITHLDTENANIWFREHSPQFPSPEVLAAYIQVRLGSGGANYLTSRKRGPAPDPRRLIPACVAYYLHSGALLRGKEVHKLLNQHLGKYGVELPEDGSSNAASNQLWRDVKKVGEKLLHR